MSGILKKKGKKRREKMEGGSSVSPLYIFIYKQQKKGLCRLMNGYILWIF